MGETDSPIATESSPPTAQGHFILPLGGESPCTVGTGQFPYTLG